MLKLSNTTRNAAFAALLGTGLIGSAAVTLTPVAAQAQQWHRDSDDRGFHRDWDDRYYRGWDDRFGVGVGGVGFGVYGYPDYYPYYSGYYYEPYDYNYNYSDYGPYCSDYDYSDGYCS
ncbi:MAG TPA: hypothetical protein VHT03_13605 [Rhizomicrobium sp.]|nr:hypothetical protein [Rhizomicrobium sp.]